jgi:hypothetical protein
VNEDDLIKNEVGKSTRAHQAEAGKNSRCGSHYLTITGKENLSEQLVTVLLDEGKCGLGKFIPLASICILLVAVHKRRKLVMEKRCLLGQEKKSLEGSNIPFNTLFMGKRTIVDLGHDIKCLLERRLELIRDDANSRGETHWDKVRDEFFVRKRADGRKRRH